METLRRSHARLLWTLAVMLIIADQLTKAWFVFILASNNVDGSFGEFLPQYFSLFATAQHDSIIYETYGPFFRTIHVWEPWIRWRLTTNTGAAWSMFAGNSFILSFVSVAIATLLWYVWRRNFRYHLGMTIAIGAIIGGALGNSIDRFRLREVVDFIAVRIPYIGKLFPRLGDPYDFPIFNVADSAAVCGTLALAGYLLWLDIAQSRRRKAEKHAPSFTPYRGGLQLDDEALENLRRLDTKSMPPWEPSAEELVAEQEEVSREYAARLIEQDRADDLPALTADYSQTASAREVTAREWRGSTTSPDATVNGGTDEDVRPSEDPKDAG